MDLTRLFGETMLEEAVLIYQDNRVFVLDETSHSANALVYDDVYYLVTLHFNTNRKVVYMSVTSDGIIEENPFLLPYGAAVMISLFHEDKFEIKCSYGKCEKKTTNQDEAYFAANLKDIQCYQNILSDLSRYMLRIQNYNTDQRLDNFSIAIDGLFEYFDSFDCKRKQLIAIQTFIHLYSQLSFKFENTDIHHAIIDECNQRIDSSLRKLNNPFHRYYYHALLLEDQYLYPYLSNYNRSSKVVTHNKQYH